MRNQWKSSQVIEDYVTTNEPNKHPEATQVGTTHALRESFATDRPLSGFDTRSTWAGQSEKVF